MLDSLKQTFHRLISEVQENTYRYLYSQFNIDARCTGIVGARGVGKTTLMLQYIKNNLYGKEPVIYCSADNIYFSSVTLWKFVETMFQEEDTKLFFIDEIHKYPNWDQELKNIYDSFPSIKVVFSGSSSIDLTKGSYDLSRRVKLYRLAGLSFREYLKFEQDIDVPAIHFSQLLQEYKAFDQLFSVVPMIKNHWLNYLKHGFYPFYREGLEDFYDKVQRIIEKTVFEDIANFYSLKTPNLHYFKKILLYLAAIPPGELNINSLANKLGLDHKTAYNYISILSETKLARLILPDATGNQVLRKPEKLFIQNTVLLHTLNKTLSMPVNVGMERELFFCQAFNDDKFHVYYSKEGDFIINGTTFEIGGKNKTSQKNISKAKFIVKDNVWTASNNIIPLACFGFLY